MAKKLLKSFTETKVGGFSLADALGVAVLKSVSEQALIPVIGNGDWRSGTAKLITAGVMPSVRKVLPVKGPWLTKLTNLEATALAIDGTEDVARSLMALVGGGSRDSGRGVM